METKRNITPPTGRDGREQKQHHVQLAGELAVPHQGDTRRLHQGNRHSLPAGRPAANECAHCLSLSLSRARALPWLVEPRCPLPAEQRRRSLLLLCRAALSLAVAAHLGGVSDDAGVGEVQGREGGEGEDDGLCVRRIAAVPRCSAPRLSKASADQPARVLLRAPDHERRFGLQAGFWIQYDTEPTGTVNAISRTDVQDSTSSMPRVVESARATGWDRDPTRLQMTVRRHRCFLRLGGLLSRARPLRRVLHLFPRFLCKRSVRPR
jgi:hypothetical protein